MSESELTSTSTSTDNQTLQLPRTLEGSVALVTGGSGDIGSGIARRLGLAGAHVVVAYVGAQNTAEATAQDIT